MIIIEITEINMICFPDKFDTHFTAVHSIEPSGKIFSLTTI
jgi:hypothetical protein